MSEITRVQFAIAAVIVAAVAWMGARALRPGAAGSAPAAAVIGGMGEPGTRPSARASGRSSVAVTRGPAKKIVVHVAGAVRKPGVYRLTDGDRVADAVQRAGGRAKGADLDAINLAAKAKDGVQILVPHKAASGASGAGGATGGAAPTAGASSAPGAAGAAAPPVNINSASAAQLETLDGVGPATSAKIIQYRTDHGPFKSVDDLQLIPGIGPKKLAAMRPHATV